MKLAESKIINNAVYIKNSKFTDLNDYPGFDTFYITNSHVKLPNFYINILYMNNSTIITNNIKGFSVNNLFLYNDGSIYYYVSY